MKMKINLKINKNNYGPILNGALLIQICFFSKKKENF